MWEFEKSSDFVCNQRFHYNICTYGIFEEKASTLEATNDPQHILFALIPTNSRSANNVLYFLFLFLSKFPSSAVKTLHWIILEWNVFYCLVTVPFEKVNKAIVNPQMGNKMKWTQRKNIKQCCLFSRTAFNRLTVWHRHCSFVHETVSLSCLVFLLYALCTLYLKPLARTPCTHQQVSSILRGNLRGARTRPRT